MKESNMPKADFVTSIVLFAFSVTIIILSVRMPRMEEVGADPYSVPGIVPAFLGGILLLLSIILLIRSVLKGGAQLNLHREKVSAFFKDEAIIRVLLTISISVMYAVVLLGRTPYMFATFLYVMAFVMIFEYRVDRTFRGQEKIVIFSCVQALLVAGIVAAVFRYLFLVKLP